MKVTPQLITLVQDAALKSFWRKDALRQFIRGCGVQEAFISTWSSDETKRVFLFRLFEALQKSRDGETGIRRMSVFLAEQTNFPDLVGWEDSVAKIADAKTAVKALADFIRRQDEELVSERERQATRTRFEELRQQRIKQTIDLDKLNYRLTELSRDIGSSKAGYDFQTWFFDLLSYFETDLRRPYVTNGRQIDGSVTVDGTTYLVELKFTKEQAGAEDIDSFYKKVVKKADNTMGLMLSVSGYSSVAIDEASSDRTPLLLLDYNHVYALLSGSHTFAEVVKRVRRHAAQTGRAFLALADF